MKVESTRVEIVIWTMKGCIGTWEDQGRWEPQGKWKGRWDPGKHHQGPEQSSLERAWV